ncbi:transglycosylase domain-containing protein [Streptomyces rochei]|uniref:Transglycosylase domain-containing protein n=1 Tax=Streptomyces rochei TaxID=1928 RepID=A0AAX3ZUI9_STRRO|nr:MULTISPECIES: transglycosylase domain-containing protein [Streptomyces]MBQ0880074.1 penicillin-binding protein [Streptomyces sp. RT42]MBX4175799.1 penicillin-binding protein [Streptomyces geysiriensis]NUV91841.1 penicillin-binding protein [Streptomyces sp. KAI 90]UAX58220.1 penicillin-binding protein [Streptomyces sp. A144]WMC90809.1 transglycosylase domain-containing protein [Streptomyces rochei]
MGRAEERRARQRGGRRAAPKRRRSSGAGGKSGIRRLFTWKKILGTFFGLCLLGMGSFIVLYLVIDIPEGNPEAELQSNVYKYSDGSIMTRTGDRNREIVDLAKVPKEVQRTFVAAENKTFYKDSGVDLKGTARGVLNTLSGKGAQGGSTITQQYVKNYYLSQEQTVTRKLKELVISLKLDREKSKDYILAGYINTSYYGRGAYGIQAAAQAYYRVDAEDLTVEQGAYLAALLQAPNQYDWAIASETGKKLVQERWNYVLDNMVEEDWLSRADRQGMEFPVPEEPKTSAGMGGQNGYLVDAANYEIRKQLVAQGAAEDMEQAKALLDLGGYTVTLNVDRKKQAELEKAVKAKLTSKLDPDEREVDADVQAGAVSVDPKTGGVVAMYGGVDYVKHFTNNATRDDYQPASTFKPVILAAAVDQDAETQDGVPITANTIYDGTSKRPVVDQGRKVGFAPPNEDDVDYDDITVQEAMNKSVNSVFAQMGVDVGMDRVMKVAGDLGMNTEGDQAVPAQTLGSMGASPLEMAGVYATLDNHGKKVTPAVVKSVEHKDRTVEFPEPIGEQVISREAADTVTSVLTGVVDDGTAKKSVRDNPLRDGQTVAGKTGTSDNNKSAWFSGYTPELVTSVGLFGEDPKTHAQVPMYKAGGVDYRVNGGGFPAEIWAAYTFGVMDEISEFDLETKQGNAVKPSTTPTQSQSPTQSPTEEETTEAPETEEPTTEAPTTEAPETESPTQSPSQSPSNSPSSEPPTDGQSTEPENPLFPDGDRQER